MEPTLKQHLVDLFQTLWTRYRRGVVYLCIANVLLVVNPLILRKTADAEHTLLSLCLTVCCMLLIASVAVVCKRQMRVVFLELSFEAEEKLREHLFKRIQKQSQRFFDEHGTGELLSRLTSDLAAYREFVGLGVLYLLNALVLLLPCYCALFWINTSLTMLAVLPLCTIPLLHTSLRKVLYTTSKKSQEELATLSDLTQEHYAGIRVVKGYSAESSLFRQFSRHARRLAQLTLKLSVIQGLLWPLFGLMARMITLLVVMYAGWRTVHEALLMPPADFAAFMWIQSYLFFPVLTIGWVIPMFQKAKSAYTRLKGMYEEPIEVQECAKAPLDIPPKAAISFRNLNFSYPTSSHAVLKDVNVTIEGGSLVGITGPVGAGKSTLFRLLNREYEIPRGMLSIADRDIHDYPLKAFQQHIVNVEQLPFLFSNTLAENVHFGNESYADLEVETAVRFADLHDTVLAFPEQYETLVGERGVRLSGGQKQRVAMARAFLLNGSILLLDNVFSALDYATEKRVFAAIKQRFKGKTILLITQRFDILSQLDRVLVLERGRIVEDGTPEGLMALNGIYSSLEALNRRPGER